MIGNVNIALTIHIKLVNIVNRFSHTTFQYETYDI
jgi:hypothetical protein